jgi:hypothetical protein
VIRGFHLPRAARWLKFRDNPILKLLRGCNMKRSRRVVLTMMGSGAVGAVSMGFVARRDCGPESLGEVVRGLDGRPVVTCQGVAYGGFGYGLHRLHGHGHGHAHGGG